MSAPKLSVARLIHLLIVERAARIAATRVCHACQVTAHASDSDRDQARAEIEREVLNPPKAIKP